MDTVLIIGSEKMAGEVARLMVPRHYGHAVHVTSAAKARRVIFGQEWGLAVISAPLPDESARLFAQEMLNKYQIPTLLIDKTASEGSDDGVITLTKPVNRVLFEHTIWVMRVANMHLAALRDENRKLTGRLEEARLVGRAKCALVAYRQMTEEEAHHYIEKQAMDSRLPRKEVARDILKVFEDA